MKTHKRCSDTPEYIDKRDCARWKRKNRTASHKRTIATLTARLGYIVQFATETIKELNETGKSKLGHRRSLAAIKEIASGSGITPLPHITAEEKDVLRVIMQAGDVAEKTALALFEARGIKDGAKVEQIKRKAEICRQLKEKFNL